MSVSLARRPRSKMWLGLVALLLLGLVYFLCPRQANLRAVDPAVVGRLETSMWRHHDEHEYFSLFRALYSLTEMNITSRR